MKSKIIKIILVLFAAISVFGFSGQSQAAPDGCNADSDKSVWNCMEWTFNPTQEYVCPYDAIYQSGVEYRTRVIRGDASPPSNWGNKCAVDCPDPTKCGPCECRCSGKNLYCSDVWEQGGGTLVSRSCRVTEDASICIPTATIDYPSNNSTHIAGQNINLRGHGTDPNGEEITDWRWRIRTLANYNADIRDQDIYRYDEDSSINLSAGIYYVFYAVKNKQGAWSGWKNVRITVRNEVYGTCGSSGSQDSSDPKIVTSKPTSNLCVSPSTPGTVNGTGTSSNPWNWICGGDYPVRCYAVKEEVAPADPAVTLDAFPDHVYRFEPMRSATSLTWRPTNSTWCWAEGDDDCTGGFWGIYNGFCGWKASSGTPAPISVTPEKKTTYSIRCGNDSGQEVTDSKTVLVCGDGIVDSGEECDDGNSIDNDSCSNSCKSLFVPSIPTVNLTAVPSSVDAGESTELTWVPTNATWCWVTGGPWVTGTLFDGRDHRGGSQLVYPNENSTYEITCGDDSGNIALDDASVTVNNNYSCQSVTNSRGCNASDCISPCGAGERCQGVYSVTSSSCYDSTGTVVSESNCPGGSCPPDINGNGCSCQSVEIENWVEVE